MLPASTEVGGRLSSLQPSALNSGLAPASRPTPYCVSRRVSTDVFPAGLSLPRGPARVKVSALSARSAAPWR